MKRLLLCILVLTSSQTVYADQVTIEAHRDAGFFAAGFNGGVPSFTFSNMGAHTHVPVSQANNDRINRSVFDFNVAGNVPACSVINSVTFQFQVSQQGGAQGMASVNFSLHRVTTAWDEGTGVGDTGEVTGDGVTWDNATGTNLWNNQGGDFAAISSGTVLVNGPNLY
jgi:hypothetical protein